MEKKYLEYSKPPGGKTQSAEACNQVTSCETMTEVALHPVQSSVNMRAEAMNQVYSTVAMALDKNTVASKIICERQIFMEENCVRSGRRNHQSGVWQSDHRIQGRKES